MKEFRVVIKNRGLINPDQSTGKDFNDYYLSRAQRIRHNIKDNDWFKIDSEPGMIIKELQEINEEKAKEMIKDSILIIKKNGLGKLFIGDIEGYAEEIIAFHPNEETPFLQETQIEFETDFDNISVIKEQLEVEKIIEVGLFDYLNH